MHQAKGSAAKRTFLFLATVLLAAAILSSAAVFIEINQEYFIYGPNSFEFLPGVSFEQSRYFGRCVYQFIWDMHALEYELFALTKPGQIVPISQIASISPDQDWRRYNDYFHTKMHFIFINRETGVSITNADMPALETDQIADAIAGRLMQNSGAYYQWTYEHENSYIDTNIKYKRPFIFFDENISGLPGRKDFQYTLSLEQLSGDVLADDSLLKFYYQTYLADQRLTIAAMGVFLVGLGLLVLSWTRLIRYAGSHKGREEICLNWIDRLYAEILVIPTVIVLAVLYMGTRSMNMIPERLFFLTILYAVAGVLLLSLIRRKRAGILVSQTLGSKISRSLRQNYRQHSLFQKAVVSWIAVSLMIVIIPLFFTANIPQTSLMQVLLWLITPIIYLPLLRWIIQFQAIGQMIERIGSEAAPQDIPLNKMPRELRQMMIQLTGIGRQTQAAIAGKLKSERLRTDLITNVSHDLKTPLTSIISYLDLLKRSADVPDKRLEYIGILEQKAQRLKTLTDNLTEAAKASSGSLPVQMEPVNLNELASQLSGEYADRLNDRGLTLIVHAFKNNADPNLPILIESDGRHIWRILDNLMTNVCKYAQEGTRVFIDLLEDQGKALIIIKNISQELLNCSADELQQRFVRGDQSRHREGAGLGLAIATSLAELLDGKLLIQLDGDLFKATLELPLNKERAQNLQADAN